MRLRLLFQRFFRFAVILLTVFFVYPSFAQDIKPNEEKNQIVLSAEQQKALDEHRQLEAKYNVKRGSRPPINLDKVPEEAYEKGILRIKLKPWADKSFDKRYIHAGKNGFVETGIKAFDEINKAIGAQKYERSFDVLYDIPGKGSVEKYRERHQAWGFNLIREIEFDKKYDVVAVVKQFAALNEVEYAEPVYKKRQIKPINQKSIVIDKDKSDKFIPNDPLLGLLWGLNNTGQEIDNQVGVAGVDVRALDAWEIEQGNPDFIVAIIDDGIEYDHEDLAGNMWSERGWNFVNNNATINPGDHGTHVAGTVAAVSNNGIGVSGLAGGSGNNDGARLMSCQVFDGNNAGGFEAASIYAADNHASISQNSWGYTSAGFFEQSMLDAIDYFNEVGGGGGLQGGITIYAAGNDHDDGQWYPAYYEGAMAVASHNNQGRKCYWGTGGIPPQEYGSNYGDWVEISAPGTDIGSTGTGGAYIYMSGTSMACPHVSGAAALIVSNTEGELTAQELRDALNASVWDIYQYETDATYAGKLGGGALDAAAALVEAQSYLGGVPNPRQFNANPMSDQIIELSWELNEHNDDVLVAWEFIENEIGTPVNGNTYNVGDPIPDGGTVLYVGNAASFSHTGLNPETGYRYRIWAIAAEERQDNQDEWYQEGDYSSGRSTTANTFVELGVYILPPRELDHVVVDETNVELNWLTPLIYDSFEIYDDFALDFGNWTQHDLDGSETWAIQDVTFTNQGYTGSFIVFNPFETNPPVNNAEPRSGQKYAAAFAAVNPPNDDWLVSPAISIKDGHSLSFWHRSYTDQYGLDRFRVGISTTGTNPGDFTIVSAGAYIESPIEWTEFTYDLSTYDGQEIHIAIHCVTDDAFILFIDDFEVLDGTGKLVMSMFDDEIVEEMEPLNRDAGKESDIIYKRAIPTGESVIAPKSEKSHGGYKVYRNGTEISIITGEKTLSFTDTDLADGTYYYTVTTLYENPVIESPHSNEIEVIITTGPSYTITALATAGGTITPSGAVIVPEGESQTFTITPDEGYYIDDVVVDGISQGAIEEHTFTNVVDDHTINAIFEQITYTLTVNADPAEGGTVLADPDLAEYAAGASVDLTPIPAEGFLFSHFTGDIDTYYTIQASAGDNGNINPAGTVLVAEGGDQTFNFLPDANHKVAEVLVNDVAVDPTPINSYTITNLMANATIEVTFEEAETYTIMATSGLNGSINPAGDVFVVELTDSPEFTFHPDEGFIVADVSVDGGSVGTPTSYTFNIVTQGHTIHVTFEDAPSDPCLVTNFPWIPNFSEDVFADPDECWGIEYEVGAVDWVVDTNAEEVHYDGTPDDASRMVTPVMQLSGMASATLTFEEYRPTVTGQDRRNTLHIEYWDGNIWQNIATYDGVENAWTARTVTLPVGGDIEIGFHTIQPGQGNSGAAWQGVRGIEVAATTKSKSSKSLTASVIMDQNRNITAHFFADIIMGDVNSDGVINILDVVFMIQYLTDPENPPEGFNEDAANLDNDPEGITVLDLVALIEIILERDNKDTDVIKSKPADLYLMAHGLVNFDSDGTLTALQFELDNPMAVPELLLETDHNLAYNNNTGRGIIYSLTNTLIPEGKIGLMSIKGVDVSELEWAGAVAANTNPDKVPVKTHSADSSTEINDVVSSDLFDVKVFPNPNTGEFTLSVFVHNAAYIDIELIDETGRVITKKQRKHLVEGEHMVNFGSGLGLKSGIYVVRVVGFNEDGRAISDRREEKIMIIK